jgi:hypothetical protein
LYGFSLAITSPPHKGLRYLISIGAYLFIVFQGWYGTFLIPLLEAWFTIMLIFGLVLFLVSKIIHPTTIRKIGSQVAPALGKIVTKEKQREVLEKELRFIRKRLKDLEKLRAVNPAAAYDYEQYKRQEKEIKRKLEKM